MDRRESLKTLLSGATLIPFLRGGKSSNNSNRKPPPVLSPPMRSRWTDWPDMQWAGPEYWGNRLQDWPIRDGKLECAVSAPNRSLHRLTHQLERHRGDFTMSVELEVLNRTDSEEDRVGFRLGARAGDQPVRVRFDDWRRNAVFGEGLHAGLDGGGRLRIGEPDEDRWQEFENVAPVDTETIVCSFD